MKFEGELVGDRIFLKQMNTYDINEEFIGWLHNPDTNRFLDVRRDPPDLQQQKRYVELCISSPEKLYFGIFLTNLSLIGSSTVSLHSQNKAEVGIMIGDRTALGKGYGKEAVRLLIQWASSVGIREITAGYSVDNVASEKLFASLGFQIQKEPYGASIVSQPRDVIRTSLLVKA